MKAIFSLLFLFMLTNAFAGTPGMNDTSMIYGLVLLIIGVVAGISFIVNWTKNRIEINKLDQISEQEDDDSEYFNQTGF